VFGFKNISSTIQATRNFESKIPFIVKGDDDVLEFFAR
jgi:hypothetical protein